MELTPFHLAIPVANLNRCRQFYREVLQCEEGRTSDKWIDFNLFGHQFVIHEVDGHLPKTHQDSNLVDGHDVPVPHFGVILNWENWHELAERLQSSDVQFVIEPCIRFKGEVGEQATLFFLDPEGNALEFKAFRDPGQIFAK